MSNSLLAKIFSRKDKIGEVFNFSLSLSLSPRENFLEESFQFFSLSLFTVEGEEDGWITWPREGHV